MDVDAQGIKVEEFEDLICDRCHNAPLAYYCPMCDFRACLDCLRKSFKRQRNGSLVCKNCGHADTVLSTFVGDVKV